MDIEFENLQIWFDQEDEDDEAPVLIACRDREECGGERFVVTSLSIEQARAVRDYLNTILKD